MTGFLKKRKKTCVMLLLPIMSLAVFVLSELFAKLILKESYGLMIGLLLILAAAPVYLAGGKNNKLYFACFLMNSVANGFSVSAYYLQKSVHIDFLTMIISILPSVIILCLIYILVNKYQKSRKIIVWVSLAVIVALSAAAVYLWLKTGSSFYSFAFFSFIITACYAFIFRYPVESGGRTVLNIIAKYSFVVFIILALAIITLLTDGEGFDLDIGGGGKKTKKH